MDRHVTANYDDEFYPFTLNDLASASMKPNDYVDLLKGLEQITAVGCCTYQLENTTEKYIYIYTIYIYIYKVLPITGHEGPEGQ